MRADLVAALALLFGLLGSEVTPRQPRSPCIHAPLIAAFVRDPGRFRRSVCSSGRNLLMFQPTHLCSTCNDLAGPPRGVPCARVQQGGRELGGAAAFGPLSRAVAALSSEPNKDVPIPRVPYKSSQGPHDGKDQGASQYLAFAAATAYGGKPYITTLMNRQGPPVTTAPVTIAMEQRTDVTLPGTPEGVDLDSYNETLWFTARDTEQHAHTWPVCLHSLLFPLGPHWRRRDPTLFWSCRRGRRLSGRRITPPCSRTASSCSNPSSCRPASPAAASRCGEMTLLSSFGNSHHWPSAEHVPGTGCACRACAAVPMLR